MPDSNLKNSFTKQERLCSKKQIDYLFGNGKGFYANLLKLTFVEASEVLPFPSQLVISVSKRNFKSAVDRNRIKRLIREVFRKNKHSLYEHLQLKNKQLLIGLLFVGKEIPTYNEIEIAVLKAFHKLIRQM